MKEKNAFIWALGLQIEGHMVYVYKNFQEKMYFSFTIQYQEVIRKCFKLKFKVTCQIFEKGHENS